MNRISRNVVKVNAWVASATVGLICFMGVQALAQSTVPWEHSLAQALTKAQDENKLVFMDVYAEWCPPCKKLDKDTFGDPTVVEALSRFVPLKINADEDQDTAAMYQASSLPTLIVLNSEGGVVSRGNGFMPPEDFIAFLASAEDRLENLKRLETEAESAPEATETVLKLINEYMKLDQAAKALAWMKRIEAKVEAESTDDVKAEFDFTHALALMLNGEYPEGVAKLEKLKRDFPDNARTRSADDLIEKGRFFHALAQLDEDDYDPARQTLSELAENAANARLAQIAAQKLKAAEPLGKPAPEIDVSEWLAGAPVSIGSLKGKVILVNMFHTGQPSYEGVRLDIMSLRDRFGREGLETLAIVSSAEGQPEQKPEDIAAFVKEKGYPYPVGVDKDLKSTLDIYKAQTTPWVVLVDKKGNVRYSDVFDAETVTEKVEALLKDSVE